MGKLVFQLTGAFAASFEDDPLGNRISLPTKDLCPSMGPQARMTFLAACDARHRLYALL